MLYLDRKMKEVSEMLSNSETDASNIIYDDILCDSEMQDLAECIRITSNTPLCPCLLMKRSCI